MAGHRAVSTETPLGLEEALARVRAGIERRVALLGARVGDDLARHVGRPGKMLRSRYALALGSALGVPESVSENAARAVEIVHNASLLHDDCVDKAAIRRGSATPNGLFGQTSGILLGDLAFAEGLEEAMEISPSAARELVGAVREMAVGELQEEFLGGSLRVSVEGYLGIAARKTAALFEWCGAVLSQESPHEHRREDPPRLGRAAGVLLQIIDDIHDLTLDAEVSGKEPGQDFILGKLTLPCILAMDDPSTRGPFLELWNRGPRERGRVPALVALLEKGGHIDGARRKGREILDAALPMAGALPVSEAAATLKQFMEALARREF